MLARVYRHLTSNRLEDDVLAISSAGALLTFLWALKLALIAWFIHVKEIQPLADAPFGGIFLIGASDVALCAAVAGIYYVIFKLSRLLTGRTRRVVRETVPLLIHTAIVLFTVVSFVVTRMYLCPLEIELVRSAADPSIIRSSLFAYAGVVPLSLMALGVVLLPVMRVPLRTAVDRVKARSRIRLWGSLGALVVVLFFSWGVVLRGIDTYGVKQNAILYFIAHYKPPITPVDLPQRLQTLRSEIAGRESQLEAARSIALPDEKLPRDYPIAASGDGFNVIFVQMESTSAAWCNAETTPNLHKLAQRGVHFTNHFTTYAQTTKATYDLYYSDYLMDMGGTLREVYGRALPQPSLSEMLKQAGYDTALIASSFFSYDDLHFLFQDKGIDQIIDADSLEQSKADLPWSWGVSEEKAVGALEEWIAARNGRKFFAIYSNTFPHHPYYCPLEKKPFADDTWLGKYRNALYYADLNIGRLVNWLTTHQLIDRTLIVLVGDHGETVSTYPCGHGLALTMEEIKVPMVISNPRLFPEAQASRLFTNHLDVAPTILGLLNLSAPKAWLGRDLSQASIDPRLLFLYQQNSEEAAVIDNGVLFAYHERRDSSTLYDLRDQLIPLTESDPRQKLAADYEGLPELYGKWALMRHLQRARVANAPRLMAISQ